MSFIGAPMSSRRVRIGRMLALVCAVALVGSIPWASAATVAEIAKNPAAFDQKTVTVNGMAEEINSRTSRRGNSYTTFRLSGRGRRGEGLHLRHAAHQGWSAGRGARRVPAGEARRGIHLPRRDRRIIGERGEVALPGRAGGPDAPSNMQWQTRDAARAQDRWESR